MEVKQNKLDNGKVDLEIIANPGEVDEAFAKGIALMLDQVGVPMPEDAKSPYDAMSKLFGSEEQVDQAAASAVINYLMPYALNAADITIVTSPIFDQDNITTPQQGLPYLFHATVTPKPYFELESYEPVTVTVERPTVAEGDIDAQIQMMAEQAATSQTDIMTGQQKRVVPEITDEWVDKNIPDADCKTVADLRERVRAAGEKYMESELENRKMNAVITEMTKNFKAEIPADIIRETAHDFAASFKANCQAQGMDFQEVLKQQQATEEQFEYDMETQARAMLTQGFTLDAVFKHAGLEVTDSDIDEAISGMAEGQDLAMVKKQLEETGRLFAVTEAAERLKSGQYLLDNAKITVL